MRDQATGVDRVFELAGAICDEYASEEECVELDLMVVADETSRRGYWNYCWMHVLLGMEVRVPRAIQRVQERDSLDSTRLAPWESEALEVALPLETPAIPPRNPVLMIPAHELLIDTTRGQVGRSASDWPMAYLTSAVICVVGLLILALIPVHHYDQLANVESGTGSLSQEDSEEDASDKADEPLDTSLPPLIGQITGMVDCKWSDDSTFAFDAAYVPLGRKYALASGLMEITYDTGAKVILQGPCTYEVESPVGGYLSVGKLTAKVEKKVASDQWPVVSESKIRGPSLTTNHQPLATSVLSTLHSPLFTIKTPTAVVTDLGTEFGVEVSNERTTTSQVFQGTVDVQFVGTGHERGQTVRLTANESVRIDKQGTATRQTSANNMAFVRSLRQQPDGKEVPVANGGFENPALAEQHGVDPYGGWYRQDADTPTGWQKIGTAGIVTGGDAPIGPNLTDGGQWGFCNGKSESNPVAGVLYQAIATIDAATDYTVSAEMAVQTHWGEGIAFKLSLWAGAAGEPTVELASVSGKGYVNPKRAMVVSHAAKHAAYAGQTLFIRMEGIEDDKQILFDNVRVRAREASNRPQATKVLQSPDTKE